MNNNVLFSIVSVDLSCASYHDYFANVDFFICWFCSKILNYFDGLVSSLIWQEGYILTLKILNKKKKKLEIDQKLHLKALRSL